MNLLGQVVLVVGLSLIGAIAWWVYRKDQQVTIHRTAFEWERITGLRITSVAPWVKEGISVVDPISREHFIRLVGGGQGSTTHMMKS